MMKIGKNTWWRGVTLNLAVWSICVWSVCATGGSTARPLGPSDRPEAYFNGSSCISVTRPISLRQIVGLSFRTCVGGELFSLRSEGHTLHVTALYDQVVVSWARPGQPRREVGLARETLDNRWHWVALRYRPHPPTLLLQLDNKEQVISNKTWNPWLVSGAGLQAADAVVLVGCVFSGCILEGPQLEFHVASTNQIRNVVFGHCPLTTDACKDKKDVLRTLPIDHCYNEPCLRHGTCISRLDRYECHCTARYSGNNCQVDKGSPCASTPCQNAGRCVEDDKGDFICDCPPQYHGAHCELEVSLDPQCVVGPCRNNGSCSVPPAGGAYVCDCLPGFTGRNCETDMNECMSTGAGACINGGRCVDAANNYTCDCTGTGYSGMHCEVNVNECVEERGVCGLGVCYDMYGSFVCVCPSGYTGERCQRVSPCSSSPCVNGECVEEAGGFHCMCTLGWTGTLCEYPVSCADLACPLHSHCQPSMNSVGTNSLMSKQALCACDSGYYGAPGLTPNCSTLERACELGVCLNGASCSRAPDHFNCTCAPGYKGAYCELSAGKALSSPPPERCLHQPCAHATLCTDTAVGFHCECEAGWTGVRCDVRNEVVDACSARPCLNGGVCRMAGEGFVCECRAGYSGAICDLVLDCRTAGCPHHQECSEGSGVWLCAPQAEAVVQAACASSPCHNGTCQPVDATRYQCICPHGINGHNCEVDVDECALMPTICNHGVCVNVFGSYECYCKPGYTGDSCEQDIDECLSIPCKNNGTCQNLENNYECTCMEGFEGKDCSVNINECSSNPCAAGATCVDGVASYACVCQDGLTGAHCEIDIDDCESTPCLHGGRCQDGLNSYTCECGGTGYAGADCELNIDECAPQPCRNGGSCRDETNDYRCLCHPGYTGKNCEVDVNECESSPCQYGGVCLERSNVSLYRPANAPPELVGPQPHMFLPASFYEPFTLESSSGFECVCVSGTTGSRCEVNVDECASSPCGHGKCVDDVGGYHCTCSAGYEGDHCEREIDECQRYSPCAHGVCYDRRASYYCLCAAGWGGRNCSVVLNGCRDQPCRNHGTCLPWLYDETQHRFNCSCAPGFYGTTCEKITTMSLEKSSYAEVNTSREEGYDISFRFKTTLGSGLLAMGRGFTYFFLELSSGRLNLHSSLLNKWEGVFIGSNLNDSNWQKVFVTINSSHLVLAANEEQTIYPISQNEAYNSSVTSFPSTRLGTAGSSYAPLTHGPNFFVGCFQDVVVNGQWVLPELSNSTEVESKGSGVTTAAGGVTSAGGAVVELRGVLASCPRAPQCEPNPCRSGGVCEDAWTSFICSCPRPHLGHTCQYNYTAATFGHELATPRSVVRVVVSEAARLAVHSALDISMFIRTRKPMGQIFYLGSMPRYGMTEETLVAASLKGGELLVHLRFNQTPEDYTVGGTRLDNGYLHLIQVVRNSTLVQVKLNGTEYFRKSISAAKQLDAQVLYLGGPPPPAELALPPGITTTAPPTTAAPPSDDQYFKGVIQDVQISNGVNVSVVEFFPLAEEGLWLPTSFGEVSLDEAGVKRGVVSDDSCARGPCLHNATCTVTWNDYMCSCPSGYKGKQCAEVEFCQLQGCPPNSLCRNLDGGYECLSNATFDGINTTLRYEPRVPTSAPPPQPHSLTITYRSKSGGTLLFAWLPVGNETWWFSVGVFRAQVSVQWRLGAGLPQLRRMHAAPPAPSPTSPPAADQHDSYAWTTLRFNLSPHQIHGAFVSEGREDLRISANIDTAAWRRLMASGTILLGGVRPHTSPPTTTPATTPATTPMDISTDLIMGADEDWTGDNSAGEYFKGCMGAVRVGDLLLPFFSEEELFVGAAASVLRGQTHYALVGGRAWGAEAGLGCVLCLERECRHGGRCADVRHSYACACPPGYAGDYCEHDVDECLAHACRNNATCLDGLATYTCVCASGFTGQFCEEDIDECVSSPCEHGGICSDLAGGFSCQCTAEWTGTTCQRARRLSCQHRPCAAAHGSCLDTPPDPPTGNNYTCRCEPGYEGVHCENAFCEVRPCLHGQCSTDAKVPSCECEAGYRGMYCEVEINECTESGGDAVCSKNGGRCIDQLAGYLCDCAGTGWQGARCETDVDECASGHVNCGPGECKNHDGGYTCQCSSGFCGHGCALQDPCFRPDATPGGNSSGPCQNGGVCQQRCSDVVDYICECVQGWGGTDCEQQVVSGEQAGGSDTSTVLVVAGCLVLALALLAGAGGMLAAQARRKRATRGTYSPSGQEYSNPRAEMMHHALKPPPEERLI